MKNTLRAAVIILLSAAFAVSCTVIVSVTAEEISSVVTETPKTEQIITEPEVEEITEREVGIVTDSDISISAADHLFKQEKLLLVTAANTNNAVNYSIDVTVTYYGAEGEVLGTETQSYQQLQNGYEKNFIFRPGFDFADYLLKTEKTVYEGECWKNAVDTEFGFSHSIPGPDTVSFAPHIAVKNNYDKILIATAVDVVLFDENGEVYDIISKYAELWESAGGIDTLPDGTVYDGYDYNHFEERIELSYDDVKFVGGKYTNTLTAFYTYKIIKPEESRFYDEIVASGHYIPGT